MIGINATTCWTHKGSIYSDFIVYRLALLCGKYESNAIALRLALGISDRAIEAYDVLLALLETELTMDQNEQGTIYLYKMFYLV